jgi:carboxypeptidase C (cathepsin A)
MNPSLARRGVFALVLGLIALIAVPERVLAQKLPAYTAKAGMLNVGKDPERPDAEIFHIDYTLKGGNPATRPVTFVFNGGPGGASIYLHLSAIGPKTVASAGDGSFPPAPAHLQDNPDSWIAFTDLVFIDPVGTGYSRMLPGPDGKPLDPTPYYGVAGDLDSIARFISQWLTVNKRWSSPKAIAGESYGGQRVAALSRMLAEQYNVNLNRAILISPALNVDLADSHYSLVAPMTLLPSYAAIASFHGLSTIKNDPAAIKEVEDYAMNGFLTGLATLGRSSPETQAAFYNKVGGLIGLSPALVERHRGRVPETVFAASLLAAKGEVIDTYDGTQASGNPMPEKEELGVFDRSLTILGGVLLPPFMDYVRNELGYVTDRAYIPLNLEVNMRWDRNSTLGGPEDLAVALAQNHDLKAVVLHGYHDLSTNYLMTRYVLEQTTRAQDARHRLFFGMYSGGHMFYLRTKSRAEATADVRSFFDGVNGIGK